MLWHTTAVGIGAVLLALAFPEPGWASMAHVGLVPAVFVAIRSEHPWRLAWTGYAVSLVWWLVQIRWIIPVTVGGHIALSLYLAFYLPVALILIRWIYRRYGGAMTFLLPIIWVSLELARAVIPAGGFTWFTLGHSQGPYTTSQPAGRLVQIADLFGEHGVSFLVAMTNGLIVDLLSIRWPAIQDRTPANGRRVVLLTTIWLLAFGGAWGYGEYRTGQLATALGPYPLRVAVIQTNVSQDNKNDPTPLQTMIDWRRMLDLTRRVAAHGPAPQIILWPETMVPAALNKEALAYYETTGSGNEIFDLQIKAMARGLQTHLIVGAPAYENWKVVSLPDDPAYFQAPTKRYNSVYLYKPDGTQASERYDKVHRVPFGEYIPWVEQIPWLKRQFVKYLSPYEVDYTIQAGANLSVFDITIDRLDGQNSAASVSSAPTRLPKVRVSTPICFEDTVARLTRQMVYGTDNRKRSDLLINLTNDGWYAGTYQGPQHLQIAAFRCIENRVPMVRSVNTGISGFIDSAGRIGPLVETNGHTQQIEGFTTHIVKLDPRRTVFGRWGHTASTWPILVALVGLGGSMCHRCHGRHGRHSVQR